MRLPWWGPYFLLLLSTCKFIYACQVMEPGLSIMIEHQQFPTMIEVAIEKKYDVLNKSWESSVVTKLHPSLRTSGLLAKLPDREFKTLICLCLFMDAEKHCNPSQEVLSESLGLSCETVTKRINRLLSFEWQGKPLVSSRKLETWRGILNTTVYSILPQSGLNEFFDDIKMTFYEA